MDKPNAQRNDAKVPEKVTWDAKTQIGLDVLAGKYKSVSEILLSGKEIVEDKIVDFLEPEISIDFINVGQAKGKFGGGKRKPSKQTQKVTKEGSKMSFCVMAIIGNKNGVLGIGVGKAGDGVAAKEKSIRNAKKSLITIRRGSGSWGSFGAGSHTIPFAVEGKCSSSYIKLMPAPKGTGLVVENEVRKVLEICGIQDVWSKTFGKTKNKINLIKAVFEALKNLQKVKLTNLTKKK